jgi:hypothetical protein
MAKRVVEKSTKDLTNDQSKAIITEVVKTMYLCGDSARIVKNGNPQTLINTLTTQNYGFICVGLFKRLNKTQAELIDIKKYYTDNNAFTTEHKKIVAKMLISYANTYVEEDYYFNICKNNLDVLNDFVNDREICKKDEPVLMFRKYFHDTERQKTIKK